MADRRRHQIESFRQRLGGKGVTLYRIGRGPTIVRLRSSFVHRASLARIPPESTGAEFVHWVRTPFCGLPAKAAADRPVCSSSSMRIRWLIRTSLIAVRRHEGRIFLGISCKQSQGWHVARETAIDQAAPLSWLASARAIGSAVVLAASV